MNRSPVDMVFDVYRLEKPSSILKDEKLFKKQEDAVKYYKELKKIYNPVGSKDTQDVY